MPAPETAEQKLLIDELGEGPGSRLLLLALSGADPSTLAVQSKALRAALAGDGQFALVANGDADLDAIPANLRPYRYLLSPRSDERRVGKECVRTCRSRWSPYHSKKNQ